MKKFSSLSLLVPFLLSACTLLPRPTQESNPSTPIPTTAATEEAIPCDPEKWVIAITSVEQTDLGDSTKLVFAKIGIENNDSLWGMVIGPDVSDEKAAQETVFLSTEDGFTYEYLDGRESNLSGQLSDTSRRLYEATGQIDTPLMPPGFVTLGKSIEEKPHYYNFSFLIPNSKMPDTITIGGMSVDCIQPHILSENGKPSYRRKNIQLPIKTYDLNTDITDIREIPSARRYPNLIGAELTTPDWKETIFITDVTRNGNTIDVTFDFTNFSSRAISPSFDGYIMGNNRSFICQDNCEQRPTHAPVEPGQTAQDLTWTFTVPEDESNLVFVYIYGGKVDLNEVYRVNLEG